MTKAREFITIEESERLQEIDYMNGYADGLRTAKRVIEKMLNEADKQTEKEIDKGLICDRAKMEA